MTNETYDALRLKHDGAGSPAQTISGIPSFRAWLARPEVSAATSTIRLVPAFIESDIDRAREKQEAAIASSPDPTFDPAPMRAGFEERADYWREKTRRIAAGEPS